MLGFLRNALAFIVGAIAVISGAATIFFPLYRAYFWLRYGFSLSYSGLDFLSDADVRGIGRAVMEIKWLGIQKAIIWLLSQPFELSCVVLAIVCSILASVWHDESAKPLEPFYKPEQPVQPNKPQWLGKDI